MPGRTSTSALIAALLTLVVACGAPAPATPPPTPTAPPASPSPSPTAVPASPSPSPTAAPVSPSPTQAGVDVVEEFLSQVTTRQSLEGAIEGEMALGDLTFQIGGSLAANAAGDSTTTLELGLPDGSDQLLETIKVGGRKYSAVDGGPFVEEELDETQLGVAEFLRTLARLEDQGPQTVDGQTLHRLTTPPDVAIDPAVLGFTDPSFEDVTVEVEFYAQPDGTPEAMNASAAWQHRAGAETVSASLLYTVVFERFGGTVEVSAPEDAWQRYESEANELSVAYPADWEVTPATQTEPYDAIDSPFGDRLLVISDAAVGDLDRATEQFLDGFNEEFPVTIDDVEETTVGGQRALLVSMTPETGNARVYSATTMGRRFVAMVLIYQEDPSTEGLDLLRAFLTTVKPAD